MPIEYTFWPKQLSNKIRTIMNLLCDYLCRIAAILSFSNFRFPPMNHRFINILILGFSFFIFSIESSKAQNHSISGFVKDSLSGEELIGANVYIKNTTNGISTNVYGFYSLSLPVDTYIVVCSFLGYESVTKLIYLNEDVNYNILLHASSTILSSVNITAAKDEEEEERRRPGMSIVKLSVDQLKNLPSAGGEVDLIKVMQLMPGVKKGDDGQTGMFVRGGDGDQNLILLDEAIVYNVAHLFGFFSIFNTDAIKDVTLIKGGFPANFGGRLSSVMDIRMNEGDMKTYHAEGGVGLLSSRLTLQGPILKDKSSFIVSGRRSYIDQVFGLLNKADKKNPQLPYYFYDINFKFNYRFSNKDRIFLNNYIGDDVLRFRAGLNNSLFNFDFVLGNSTSTFRWNHVYGSKMFSNVSLIFSRFRYDVEGKFIDNSVLIRSSIRDLGIKADYDYFYKSGNKIRFGAQIINHFFKPNVISTSGEISSAYKSKEGQLISTIENAFYLMNEREVSSSLNLSYGLRYSFSQTQNTWYGGIEPRLSAVYLLNKNTAVNASYSRCRQYMHLVSSSSIALPTDLWYPVTDSVKPQIADQISLGYSINLEKIKSKIGIETYYKWMRNLIEYKEGAALILNDNYESELVSGSGKAYGGELMFSKTEGRFKYTLAYTLSWALRKFNNINGGMEYFAKYDRRNDGSISLQFALSKRILLSSIFIYSTGSRLTPIEGQFVMPNVSLTSLDVLPIYGKKNAVVLPSSHRLDMMITIIGKKEKRYKGEWQFGAYNVYNQAQPYRIRLVRNEKGVYKYQAVGLFGFIPSIAYNFKF